MKHYADTKAVCAVILAYGNRPHLLRQVLPAVKEQDVGCIIIVANAVSSETIDIIERFAKENPALVHVTSSQDNLGSAGGYALGLRVALTCSGRQFVWLLDDDNEPLPGSLDTLIQTYFQVVKYSQCSLPVLQSFRISLASQHRLLAKGGPFLPRPGSFIGFHWRNVLPTQIHSSAKIVNNCSLQDAVPIQWASYGGLFLPIWLVQEIGFPNERLFIDYDDFEYTYRISLSGGAIFLAKHSEILDLDTSNKESGKYSEFRKRINNLPPERVYYSVRNRIYLGKKLYPGASYTLNKWMYLAASAVLAIWNFRLSRVALILRAVRDGEQGRLGKKDLSNFL